MKFQAKMISNGIIIMVTAFFFKKIDIKEWRKTTHFFSDGYLIHCNAIWIVFYFCFHFQALSHLLCFILNVSIVCESRTEKIYSYLISIRQEKKWIRVYNSNGFEYCFVTIAQMKKYSWNHNKRGRKQQKRKKCKQ